MTARAHSSAPRRRVSWVGRTRAALLARDSWQCVYCGATWRSGLSLDHIDPLSGGGSDVPANLAVACSNCNMAKGRRPLLLFLAREAHAGRRIGHRARWRADALRYRPPKHRLRSVAFCPVHLLDDPRCRGTALRAYMVLSLTADDEGWCWPNGVELARLAHRDKRFVSLAVKRLVALGYVERHLVPSAAGPQLLLRLVLTPSELEELATLPPLAAPAVSHSTEIS